MSRTGIILGALVVIIVLWFVISKAQTALDNGTKNLRQEVVSPQEQLDTTEVYKEEIGQ